MSLMVAAREKFQWSAVSSWCPITDLGAWHEQNAGYAGHVEAVCGGKPGGSALIDGEYRERSPLSFAESLQSVRLQVAHGRHDRTVPFSHSWRLAGRLVNAEQFYFSIFDGAHELRVKEAFEFFDASLFLANQAQLSG